MTRTPDFFRTLTLGLLLGSFACGESEPSGGDAGVTSDGGDCPTQLPGPATTCTTPDCTATTGTRSYGRAELSADQDWLVVSYVTSELQLNAETALSYVRATAGGLDALLPGQRRRAPLSPELAAWAERTEGHIRADERLRKLAQPGPVSLTGRLGTAVRARPLPDGQLAQAVSCTAASPGTCRESGTICLIPEGQSTGTCVRELELRYALANPSAPQTIAGTVRVVSESIAFVVDDDDAVSDNDLETLADRYEQQIRPIQSSLFGEATVDGRDRDQNGVVLVLLTSKLAALDGAPVGIFFSDDLRPTSEAAHSNAADLLYMQPPGSTITLDSISGTIAHEYQHLINFYAKAVKAPASTREETWLDEGLSLFAEEATGYGADTFAAIKVFLTNPGATALTGQGFNNEPDSIERRGMAALFVRYLFEQKGGATFADPGSVTDRGGAAAIRALTQGKSISLDAIGEVGSEREVQTWLSDFFYALALDGLAKYECFTRYGFQAPTTSSFTGLPRGIDLRKTITVDGMSLVFEGPRTATFQSESDIPAPFNAADFRTLSTAGSTAISIGGPAELTEGLEAIGLRAFPLD